METTANKIHPLVKEAHLQLDCRQSCKVENIRKLSALKIEERDLQYYVIN